MKVLKGKMKISYISIVKDRNSVSRSILFLYLQVVQVQSHCFVSIDSKEREMLVYCIIEASELVK